MKLIALSDLNQIKPENWITAFESQGRNIYFVVAESTNFKVAEQEMATLRSIVCHSQLTEPVKGEKFKDWLKTHLETAIATYIDGEIPF